jgi:hypothetical protein
MPRERVKYVCKGEPPIRAVTKKDEYPVIVKEARQQHKFMSPDEASQLLAVKARRRKVCVESLKDIRGGKVPPRICFAELPQFSEDSFHR